MALALDRWLRVDVQVCGGGDIHDSGSPDLLGGGNLVIDAMRLAERRLGLCLPGCEVRVCSDIPVARGLGSSAAAIVAGIQAACVIAGYDLHPDELVDIAGHEEGHADNVSASVFGGITVSTFTGTRYVAAVLTHDLPLVPVVFIPDNHSFTSEARGLLPSHIPLRDAATNVGNAALLAHALYTGRSDLISAAMSDRLHQPYRAAIFPHLEPCIAAATTAGAAGACLSGAGPTVLALAEPGHAECVAHAMLSAAREVDVHGCASTLAIPSRGCHVIL
jgi:homoserine kinase